MSGLGVLKGRIDSPCLQLPRAAFRTSYPHTQGRKPPNVRASSVTKETRVAVVVENTSWNSRQLFATVEVRAPVDTVWACLTDYDGLASFIPNLVENKCLEKRPRGAVLFQVGAQEVAMGVKFSAAVKLECQEYLNGVPDHMCAATASTNGALPQPKCCLSSVPARDISFRLLQGDFQAFQGIWRMQPLDYGTLLCYSLYVKPQQWLPVALVQNRIEREVQNNLQAVRKHAERLHRRSIAAAAANGIGNGTGTVA